MTRNRNILLFLFSIALTGSLLSLELFPEYQFASYYFFSFSGGVFIVFYLIFSLKSSSESKNITVDYIDLSISIYTVFIFIHSILFSGNINRSINFWFLLIPIYFILKYGFDKKDRNIIGWIFILAGVIEGFIVILQLAGVINNIDDNYTLGGTFGNPNVVAIFLVMLAPLCITFMLEKGIRKQHRIFSAIGLIFFTSIIFISACRSAILGLLIVTCTFLLYRASLKFLKVAIPVLMVVLIPLSVFFYQLKKDSADGRLLIWEVSLQMIWDKPFTGHGYGEFEKAYNNYQADYFKTKENSSSDKAYLAGHVKSAFNEFVEEWVEGGLVGIILFSSIFILFILYVFRSIKNSRQEQPIYRVASIAAILCFLTISLVNYTMNIIPVMLLFLFYLSDVSIKSKVNIQLGSLSKALILIAVSVFVCILSFRVSREGYYLIRYKKVKEKYMEHQMFSKAKTRFKKFFPYLTDYDNFLYDYSACIARQGNYHQSLKLLQRAAEYSTHYQLYTALGKNYELLKKFPEAEDSYKHAIAMIPSRLEPRFHLFMLYQKMNNLPLAKKLALQIRDMKVKVPSEKANQIKKHINIFLTKN